MDLNFSAEDEAFRLEVREFIRDNYPAKTRRKVELGLHLDKEDYVTWQKILHAKGWVAYRWPKEYGGTGWSVTRAYIFDEELALANTARIMPFGFGMLAPVLMKFGNAAQRAEHLPKILDSSVWWCQGYSEPGSGSDLASLATRAELDGDQYVINGSKIWTTYAQFADKMFCLCRTSQEDKKQKGISFLLLDMDSPGVEVRPIITINGMHAVNQVFLDNVRTHQSNLVGEAGQGWTLAKYLLGFERTSIAGVAASKQLLGRLKVMAAEQRCGGRALLEDPRFRDRIAQVEIDLMALEYTNLRVLSDAEAGRDSGGGPSLLKIKGTHIQQELTLLMMQTVGYYGLPYDREVVHHGWGEQAPVGPEYAATLSANYFDWRKSTIYGGSTEVQRNIIAKAVLGL